MRPVKEQSNEHKASEKMGINIGRELTSAYSSSALSLRPACCFTSTRETATPPSSPPTESIPCASKSAQAPPHSDALMQKCWHWRWCVGTEPTEAWRSFISNLIGDFHPLETNGLYDLLRALSDPYFYVSDPAYNLPKVTFLVEVGSSNFQNVRFQIFPARQSTTEDFCKL